VLENKLTDREKSLPEIAFIGGLFLLKMNQQNSFLNGLRE